jgi:CDP-glucose 4,6-dehydratase
VDVVEVNVQGEFWRGQRVLVTGHTGFKGSWLALWLRRMGAQVTGFALPPATTPNMFEVARVAEGMNSLLGDLRNRQQLQDAFAQTQPEIVFHLAAQSLVRRAYRDPVETYETNVIGTVNLLEAVRGCDSVRACVNVTSDKCYENQEWLWGYRESDPMGGYDPYSSSKGCAELVTAAYRQSFFHSHRYAEHRLGLASARAGNVIGGGDWAEDRLVPDIVRAFGAGEPVHIRSPQAIRPWQHVLEPLAGYLLLAQRLVEAGTRYAEGWNFGPDEASVCTVRAVTEQLQSLWPDSRVSYASQPSDLHEAVVLKLDSSKAKARLGWRPAWALERGLHATVDWYRAHLAGEDMATFTLAQIDRYQLD